MPRLVLGNRFSGVVGAAGPGIDATSGGGGTIPPSVNGTRFASSTCTLLVAAGSGVTTGGHGAAATDGTLLNMGGAAATGGELLNRSGAGGGGNRMGGADIITGVASETAGDAGVAGGATGAATGGATGTATVGAETFGTDTVGGAAISAAANFNCCGVTDGGGGK